MVNLVYTFFETFAIIHAVASGGPQRDTEILVMGLTAWQIARIGKMVRQYPWRYERVSLFSYKEKPGARAEEIAVGEAKG